MPLPQIWFPIQEDQSELQNVLNFLHQLPENMHSLISEEYSNFLEICANNEEFGINRELFISSFVEARNEYSMSLQEFEENIEAEENLVGAEQTLYRIGFRRNNLRLKARLLNGLWRRIIQRIDGFIDFANNQIVQRVRKFLVYLNSILGSLKTLVPGVEIIKEIKEVKESLIRLAED